MTDLTEHIYYEIKDTCRQDLIKYFYEALSYIPDLDNPCILDAGCGYGTISIALANKLNGSIKSVDSDSKALSFLKEKTKVLNFQNRIDICNASIFDLKADKEKYDLVIAEGLLNVLGFEKGFSKLTSLTKKGGFIIIHDDQTNKSEKLGLIEHHGFRLLQSFNLNEGIWWENYYKPLDNQIQTIEDKHLINRFKTDLEEIRQYKTNSSVFRSTYYILKNIK